MSTQTKTQAGERTQHTPGPWEIDTKSGDETCDIYNPDTEQYVASIGRRVHWKEDARLIAAAPDLLQACKEVRYFWSLGTGPDKQRRAEFARLQNIIISAIAKAEAKP